MQQPVCPRCHQPVDIGQKACRNCGMLLAVQNRPEPIFDKREQLQKIEAALLPGEYIEAVFDMKGGGTGFLGITSHRIIYYDKAFMRKMKAVVSVPYSRIQSIAAQDESGLFTGRGFFSSSQLHLNTSHGELEFEFRGADKAHIAHDMILKHILL